MLTTSLLEHVEKSVTHAATYIDKDNTGTAERMLRAFLRRHPLAVRYLSNQMVIDRLIRSVHGDKAVRTTIVGALFLDKENRYGIPA